VGYALRMRTGLIRRQIPSYHWQDRPLETWLKKDIPSQPEAYAQWRRQHSPKFFFEPFRASTALDEHSLRSARGILLATLAPHCVRCSAGVT